MVDFINNRAILNEIHNKKKKISKEAMENIGVMLEEFINVLCNVANENKKITIDITDVYYAILEKANDSIKEDLNDHLDTIEFFIEDYIKENGVDEKITNVKIAYNDLRNNTDRVDIKGIHFILMTKIKELEGKF